jgi:hypothetical protein
MTVSQPDAFSRRSGRHLALPRAAAARAGADLVHAGAAYRAGDGLAVSERTEEGIKGVTCGSGMHSFTPSCDCTPRAMAARRGLSDCARVADALLGRPC